MMIIMILLTGMDEFVLSRQLPAAAEADHGKKQKHAGYISVI